jgi:hypothetical protein
VLTLLSYEKVSPAIGVAIEWEMFKSAVSSFDKFHKCSPATFMNRDSLSGFKRVYNSMVRGEAAIPPSHARVAKVNLTPGR